MTAKQFLKKFPEAPERENCLQDIACPECGNRDEFLIEAKITTSLVDEGTDHYADSTDMCGDVEYDQKSMATCVECNHTARLRHFTIVGLDDLIYQNAPEDTHT